MLSNLRNLFLIIFRYYIFRTNIVAFITHFCNPFLKFSLEEQFPRAILVLCIDFNIYHCLSVFFLRNRACHFCPYFLFHRFPFNFLYFDKFTSMFLHFLTKKFIFQSFYEYKLNFLRIEIISYLSINEVEFGRGT